MNINNINNSNNLTFNAQLKIKKLKTFQAPSEFFETTIKSYINEWEHKARQVGTPRDTITITLGKNDINEGIWRRQNLTASAKINGLKVKRNGRHNLNFQYQKWNDGSVGEYYYRLDDKVSDFIEFVKQLSYCKVSK